MTGGDRLLLVFDVNATRSDMRPVHHAFEKVGVPGGPSRAGMRTAWLDRHGTSCPQYASTPDIRVSGVLELAARLDGGGPTA